MTDATDKTQCEPTVLDLHFGRRLRLRRESLDVDSHTVGKMVGLSAADIAAYEDGHRRFDATLVFRLSKALEIPIYWFYDGLARSMHQA